MRPPVARINLRSRAIKEFRHKKMTCFHTARDAIIRMASMVAIGPSFNLPVPLEKETMPAQAAPALEPLLSVVEIAKLINCHRRTIERERSAGRFPKPDLHIGNRPRWRPETIRVWIADKAGE